MTRRPDRPAAPRHLSTATRRWWREVVDEYSFAAHEVKLLQAAAESWDQVQAARATLAEEGTYWRDRFGQPRPHPAVKVEHDAAIRFARLVRELGLSDEPPDSRPPRLGGSR